MSKQLPGHFASRSQQRANPSTEGQRLLAVVAQEEIVVDEVLLMNSCIRTCR
jgi:hypothetical protein